MKNFFLVVLLSAISNFFLSNFIFAQENFPINGVEDNRENPEMEEFNKPLSSFCSRREKKLKY